MYLKSVINNHIKRKRKDMGVMKDKKPAQVKGANILLDLPKIYYLAAFIKT